jgi:phosphoglycolate phosphatase
MLKAIIFDFDGVIADTYEMTVSIFQRLNDSITEKQFQDHFRGNVFDGSSALIFDKSMRLEFFRIQKEEFHIGHFFELKDIIHNLSQQYDLHIISSNSDENIMHFLELGGYNGCFDKILGCNTHFSKEKKFQMIFDEYTILPEECLFITDTVGDLIEAYNKGIPSIAVSWGFHDKDWLESQSPMAIVHNPEELARVVYDYIQKEV